jgi:hypothetical protein
VCVCVHAAQRVRLKSHCYLHPFSIRGGGAVSYSDYGADRGEDTLRAQLLVPKQKQSKAKTGINDFTAFTHCRCFDCLQCFCGLILLLTCD